MNKIKIINKLTRKTKIKAEKFVERRHSSNKGRKLKIK
jgi:hypothetical protein